MIMKKASKLSGINGPVNTSVSRRSFLRGAALLAMSVPALGALSACSSAEDASSASSAANEASSSSSAMQSSSAAVAATPIVGSSVLVAYYSATGNTERVANEIASQLGAATFAIEPAEPYSTEDLNWTVESSRVSREHNDESLRDVALAQVTPDNFAGYDTIFIGYPIWWGIAAWPVDGFVEGNDFNGKTVVPFCTSASSGLGSSATNLESMANGGEWLAGQRFSSSADDVIVSAWLESLGM